MIDERILIGVIPARGKGITLEQAAVHAVMAGCKPEYFPVVVAAFEALFDASFNAHTALTSTGGAALAVVVSGPIAQEIGMNGRHNCLGSGNRANLTIGRAVRLAAMNVLGARSGELDASSFGHPGKISFCFAEDPPPAPWLPLHEQLGYEPGDTTVTMMPVEGVRQLAQQLNGDAEGILRTFATAMKTPFDLLHRQGRPGADDPRPRARRLLHRAGLDAGRGARVPLPGEPDQPRRAASRSAFSSRSTARTG